MQAYIVAHNQNFVDPIIKAYKELGYEVIIDKRYNPYNGMNSDVIFSEFMSGNSVEILKHKTKAKKVLRIHRAELYVDFSSVDIHKFDKVIFIAEHTKERAEHIVGKLDNSVIIHNPIYMDRFSIGKGKNGGNIAILGHISRLKGIGEIILLASYFTDYKFHIHGKVVESDFYEYLSYCELPDNVLFTPWDDDVNSFFADKDYIMSASTVEGQHTAVMEGMAAGLKPLVRGWIGAKEIYGKENVWNTIGDLSRLLSEKREPSLYRTKAQAQFSYSQVAPRLKKALTLT